MEELGPKCQNVALEKFSLRFRMYRMGHLKSISKVCVYIRMLILTILDRIKTKQKANEGKTK